MAKLVKFTEVRDDRKTGTNTDHRARAINPDYVVSVTRWTDSATEILLDVRSTVERVFVEGVYFDVVERLWG